MVFRARKLIIFVEHAIIMLMDNSGAAREAGGLDKRPAQKSVEQARDDFGDSSDERFEALEKALNAVDARANDNPETQRMREELKGMFANKDNPPEQTEVVGEAEPEEGLPELEKLRAIKVPENAPVMPSAFASEAQSLVDKSLKDKDPAEAVDRFYEIRWTYLQDAFVNRRGTKPKK